VKEETRMNVAIISAFDTYFDRVRLLKRFFEAQGNQVTVITSDFSHRKKEYVQYISGADILVHARKYRKNLSVSRLLSHYRLSRLIKEQVEQIHPDLIYCLLPSNSLAKEMESYKKEHPSTKLVFDVIDLWPEAMPVQKFLNLLPFRFWKNLRDHHLDAADQIFTECNLYQNVLKKENDPKYETLYWARSEIPCSFSNLISEDELHFIYLGSINNIIDIDFIVEFLCLCKKEKTTIMHLIGQGESKKQLIQKLKEKEIEVIDHGIVYSQEKKQAIFDQCNYALNIMKPSVVVGLSMKSLDYLCGGVPLINTIQGDTFDLVKKYDLGFNIDQNSIEQIVQTVCHYPLQKQFEQRENCRKVYREMFYEASFIETLKKKGL